MKKLIFLLLLTLSVVANAQNPYVSGNKRITLISPTLFRLEYAEHGKFLDKPTLFAHNRDSLLKDYTVTKLEDNKCEIKTSALRIVFEEDNLAFGGQNIKVYFNMDGKEKVFTARNYHSEGSNLGGPISTLDDVGEEIPLQDGLLTKDGWYIINDTGKEVLSNDWFELRDRDHVQDSYCFVYGNDYRTALKDLGRISGHVPMTRKYVHGIWYCRWWPYKSEEVYQLIDEYKQNNFPIDIMVLDMDWHTTKEAKQGTGHAWTKGWTGYTWNRELIPNPEKLIKDLLKDSIYVSLNEHPHDGIRSHDSMYADFMKAMGKEANGENLLYDAGSKKYMENFLKYAHGESWDMGVAFWWLDWQQDYLYPYVRGSAMSHISWLNKLYYEDSERNGLRGAGYSRWAGWGDQRHPIQFSGDAVANWEMLTFEVKLTAASGNAGCYYWAHDIGGFHGGKNPELLSRWVQFGALSAALRIHASIDKDLDRRPWIWGDQATESMRKAYHFRSEIMPYLYSSIWQTHKTMVPLNRGMYIDYNQYKQSYDNPQQFMFGDLLLAAPITKEGKGDNKVADQKVWFPEGDTWYDFFDGTAYTGGTETNVSKDIYEFPLFVKGGWILPMQPYSDRPASASLNTLRMRAYPGQDGANNSYTLYEDDGVSMEYTKGNSATTQLQYERKENNITLTVHPTKGNYKDQPQNRAYRLELPAVKEVKDIKVNNKKVKAVYDDVNKMYIINTSKFPIHKQVVINLEMVN